MKDLNPHPLSLIPPDLTKEEDEALEASLLKNGQIDDIILYEGMILDGKHKYKHLIKHGIEPKFKEFIPNGVATPRDFVTARLEGRNLTIGQKAGYGAKMLLIEKKDPDENLTYNKEFGIVKLSKNDKKYKNRTDVAVAKILGIGSTTLVKAAVLLKHDKPLFDKVYSGKCSVSAAYQEHRSKCGSKNKKPESVINNIEGLKEKIKIPSCFCYESELKTFIKTMNNHGWKLEVVFEEGKIYANWFGNGYPSVRTNWSHLTPEFEFTRAVIVAANDKKDKIV